MSVKCTICGGTSFIQSGKNSFVCSNCKMMYSKEAMEKMKAADTASINTQTNSVNNQSLQMSGRLNSTFSFSDLDTVKDKFTPKTVIAGLIVLFFCIFLLSQCFSGETRNSAANSPEVTAKAVAETKEVQSTEAVTTAEATTTTVMETEPVETTTSFVYDGVERVTVEMLCNELDKNAIRAEEYTGRYLIITGYLGSMDSDGKYFSLDKTKSSIFDSIHMTITDSSMIDELKRYDKGDTLSVYCRITDVGEILGYIADAYSIV